MNKQIKKQAAYNNFIIEQDEDNKITVRCNNTKEALRIIANEVGFQFDENWAQKQFAVRLIHFLDEINNTKLPKESENASIKKQVAYKNFIIEQDEDNKITVRCNNTKEALRQISSEIGLTFEEHWNTQYGGSRVIDFLNTQPVEVKEVSHNVKKKTWWERILAFFGKE